MIRSSQHQTFILYALPSHGSQELSKAANSWIKWHTHIHCHKNKRLPYINQIHNRYLALYTCKHRPPCVIGIHDSYNIIEKNISYITVTFNKFMMFLCQIKLKQSWLNKISVNLLKEMYYYSTRIIYIYIYPSSG